MINVLEFVGGIDGGGIGKIVLDYLKHMNLDNMNIDILVFENGNHKKQFLEDEFKKIGCNVIYITNRKQNIVKNFSEFIKVIKSKQYSLIHCHAGIWSFPYLFIAKMLGLKVRIAHGHITKNGQNGVKKVILDVMKFMLPAVTTHRYACGKDAGIFLWGKKSFTIMSNAIDCENFKFDSDKRWQIRRKFKIDDSTIVILHIGRFCYQKNNEFLIEIAKKLEKQERNFKILMIGSGELFDLVQKQIKHEHLENYVELLGMQSDIPSFLSAADVFVLPSRFEGLPIVAVESQANGLRTILSSEITDEVKLLETTKYLSIKHEEIDEWINLILEPYDIESRINAYTVVEKKGFDIKHESLSLKKRYLQYIGTE